MRDTTTRQKNLAASSKLFSSYGYNCVTTRQISKTSGCNIASISYHFGTKEKLFEACVEWLSSELPTAYEQLERLPEASDFDTAFIELSKKITSFLRAHREAVILLLTDAGRSSQESLSFKYLGPLFEEIQAFLEHWKKEGIVSQQLDASEATKMLGTFLVYQALCFEDQLFAEDSNPLLPLGVLNAGLRNYKVPNR